MQRGKRSFEGNDPPFGGRLVGAENESHGLGIVGAGRLGGGAALQRTEEVCIARHDAGVDDGKAQVGSGVKRRSDLAHQRAAASCGAQHAAGTELGATCLALDRHECRADRIALERIHGDVHSVAHFEDGGGDFFALYIFMDAPFAAVD